MTWPDAFALVGTIFVVCRYFVHLVRPAHQTTRIPPSTHQKGKRRLEP